MSTINFNNTQGLAAGRLYYVYGSPTVDSLYGPWTSEALDDFTWMTNNYQSSQYDNLIGLTIGILNTENNKQYVQEYQLYKDTTQSGVQAYHWELKDNKIVKSDQFTSDNILTIKNGCDNNGYGLFNVQALPMNINESDLIPVKYMPSDITVISSNGTELPVNERSLRQNYLYISKSDLSNYTAGIGITISQNKISIKRTSSNAGKYLQATTNGVAWVDLPNYDNPFSSSSSIHFNDEREITLNLAGSASQCGLEVTTNGVQLYKPSKSGYLYYDINKNVFSWEVGSSSSSSYSSDYPVYIQGNTIKFQYTDPFTIQNNNLALNLGSGLRVNDSKLNLKLASVNELGGINASVVKATNNLQLIQHQITTLNSYAERKVITEIDDEPVVDRANESFIGLECVIKQDQDNDTTTNKLYADMSQMVESIAPEGDVARVYIAAEDGKTVKKGQLFIKQKDIVVLPEQQDSQQLYIRDEFQVNEPAPEWFGDPTSYAELVSLANQYSNLQDVDCNKQYTNYFKDVTDIVINPLAKSDKKASSKIQFEVGRTCTVTTYGDAYVSVAQYTRSTRSLILTSGSYMLTTTSAPYENGMIITIEKQQTFSEILNS